MKFILTTLFLSLMLIGCGSNTEYVYVDREVEVEKEVEKEVIVEVAQDFEKVWLCDNNGTIEIYVDYEGRVYVDSFQQNLISVNPDGLNRISYADHPTFDVERLSLTEDLKFTYQNDFRYSSGNNVRRDSNNDLITGDKRTDFEFTLNEDKDQLQIRIKVYDKEIGQNGARVRANRLLTCE